MSKLRVRRYIITDVNRAELEPLVNHVVLTQVVYRSVFGVSGRKPTIAHAPITHDLLFASREIPVLQVQGSWPELS